MFGSIWELYCLFAMSPDWDAAQERLVIENIATDESLLFTKLKSFKLSNAHCFNPNDEIKIKKAIENGPGGQSAFESLIRDIGTKLEQHSASVVANSIIVAQQQQLAPKLYVNPLLF